MGTRGHSASGVPRVMSRGWARSSASAIAPRPADRDIGVRILPEVAAAAGVTFPVMVWLFTGKTRTSVVPGGERMSAPCPVCDELSTFREVEITTSGGVWFVDLVKNRERAWRCTTCGEVFDLRDDDATARPPLPAPEPPRDLLTELQAEAEVRAVQARRRDVQVDDELAALKKRLGK